MANVDNLKPQAHVLTVEEQSKGGKKSVESRKRTKQLKEDIINMLETGDTQNNICLELIQKALNGDVRAFEVIRDTIGEKPTDKLEADVRTDIIVEFEDYDEED